MHRDTSDDHTPRAYLWLLAFYPLAFRRRFSVDMCHTFRARLAEARPQGRLAVAVYWSRSAVHAVALGMLERLRDLRRVPAPHPPDPEHTSRGLVERLAGIFRDLRLGARSLRRRPGLAVASVLALGLGIGLTATTFSIAWGTILRGLPFDQAAELVHFESENVEQGTPLAVTPHDYEDWRAEQTTFVDLGAYVEALAHLTDESGTLRRLWGVYIDPQSFALLHVEPALGRAFSADDARPGATDVIILSDQLWRTDFGGDSTVVGRVMDLNGGSATVIGVMPNGFGFPIAEQFWRPLRLDFAQIQRGEGRLDVFGRLAPGVGLERARAEFELIGNRLASAYPSTNRAVRPILRTFQEEYVGPEFTRLVYAMLAGAVLVLLIACANVSNLLAARAMSRTREVAVRTALGAGRARVLSQFLAETAVLATLGALLGVGLARIGVTWFAVGAQAGAFRLPHGGDSLFWWNVEVSWVPLLFVLGITVATSFLAAAAPAARALRTDVGEVLKDEGRGGSSQRLSRFTRVLVVGEIALTTGLMIAAGLMVKSVLHATSAGQSLESDRVLTARVALPLAALGLSEENYSDHPSRLAFHETLLRELEARPGVITAAVSSTLPSSLGGAASFGLPGSSFERENDYPETRIVTVSPAFFSTFGVSLLEGREFTASDRAGAPDVVIVNRSFADRHFPDENSLFQQIRLRSDEDDQPWLTIVGVSPTVVSDDDRLRDLSRVFVPLGQSGVGTPETRLGRWGLRFMTVAVRTTGDPAAFARPLRDAVRAVDPTIPAHDIETFDAVLSRATARYRIFGRYYLVFALAGLCLSLIGLYAIMSFAVANRRTEIGIRMALGARARDILRQTLVEGLGQIALGLVLGAVISVWLTSGLAQILYQVERWDPAIAFATAALLLGTGTLACLIPARRAAGVDPMSAMRPD